MGQVWQSVVSCEPRRSQSVGDRKRARCGYLIQELHDLAAGTTVGTNTLQTSIRNDGATVISSRAAGTVVATMADVAVNMRGSTSRWKSAICRTLTVAASLIMLASCATVDRASLIHHAPDHGVFGITLQRTLIGRRITQLSAIPGETPFTCDERFGRGRVELVHCPTTDASAAAALFEQALRLTASLLPPLPPITLRASLAPANESLVIDSNAKVTDSELPVVFVFRWTDDEHTHRFAVRALAHEMTHAALRLHDRRATELEEETLASQMESCLEHRMFGDTRGYIYDSEFGSGLEGAIGAAVAESVSGFNRAFHSILTFTDPKTGRIESSAAFDRWCDARLR